MIVSFMVPDEVFYKSSTREKFWKVRTRLNLVKMIELNALVVKSKDFESESEVRWKKSELKNFMKV